MAQSQFRWESLAGGLQDINAFLPIIAGVMHARFPPDRGYRHKAVGRTDYRVRRGVFEGWNVRVWRQEHLIINVSAGSRFDQALPFLAGLLALAGLVALDPLANAYGWTVFPSMMSKSAGLVQLMFTTLAFLILWGALWLATRPLFWATRADRVDQDILNEIRRALPPDAAEVP